YGYGKIPWIPFLAVPAQIAQRNAIGYRLRLPNDIMESARTAVKRIVTVVKRQAVAISIKRKSSACDAIRIASHRDTEENRPLRAMIGDVAGKVLRPYDDILPVSFAVWRPQHNDRGTVGADLGFQCFGFQCVEIDFLALRHPAKALFAHFFSYGWPPQERSHLAESRR